MQRRVDDGKEENGAGTRIAGIGWGVARQIQFLFYCKTNENTGKEF